MLASYDPVRGLLAVVSEQDPAKGYSYALTGLRPADGSTAWPSGGPATCPPR